MSNPRQPKPSAGHPWRKAMYVAKRTDGPCRVCGREYIYKSCYGGECAPILTDRRGRRDV